MPNPIVYFEIGCRDPSKATDFYRNVFDWNLTGTQVAAQEGGIAGHFNSLGHEPHNYTIFYVQVDDVAKSLADVEAAGGKKIVGPISIDEGTFAWFSDPDGNAMGLWKPK